MPGNAWNLVYIPWSIPGVVAINKMAIRWGFSWTQLAFHLFNKVINWSKSTRMDFSTGTSFTKFSSIFMHLDRVIHTHKKATIGVNESTSNFFYSPSILCRLIKCPFPEKLASQNSLQNKDSEKTIKSRSNRRRMAKGKKRAGEKDRYSFVRDVQFWLLWMRQKSF